MKFARVFFSALILSLAASLLPAASVTVGIYDNYPLVFINDDQQPEGLYIEIVEAVAQQENWQIDYRHGSWNECLTWLERGEIDLLFPIAHTQERTARIDFTTESLLTNWGEVVSRPGSTIESVIDLEGKIVATLRGDIYESGFERLTEGFNVTCQLIQFESYEAVFQAVGNGDASAGVVNRMHSLFQAPSYDLVRTPIIFSPVEIRIAAPRGTNADLIDALDEALAAMKADQRSVYHRALNRWLLSASPGFHIPSWLFGVLVILGGGLILAAAVVIALRRVVTTRSAALTESESRFQMLFDNMVSGVAIYQAVDDGADFIFVDLNRAGQRMSKVSREDVIGKRVTDVFPSVAEMGLLGTLRKVWQTGTPGELPLTRYRDSRIEEWVENRVIKLPSGLVAAIYEDSSDRRRNEAERVRLMGAIEQAAESIVITDADGRIEYVNPTFEQVMGYTNGEILGKNSRILKSTSHDREFYGEMWDSLINGETWCGRLISKRKDKSLVTQEVTISPVHSPQGEIVSFVAVMRDITHEIELENQLLHAQKMETVGRLAGGVAHDFNNLLLGIIGYTGFALGQLEPGTPVHDDLCEVKAAGERAAGLTRQLLAFSRRQILHLESVDLNQLIRTDLKLLRRVIGEDIEVIFQPGDSIRSINADPTQIDQVLMNLCINSRDAMPDGGRLVIRTGLVPDMAGSPLCLDDSALGSGVMFSVSDTGCGMNASTQRKIFEPFFTTKDTGKGTGLGMAMCYGIVKQHRGWITVESEVGKGSTVAVLLPLAEERADDVYQPTGSSPVGGTETILLVEDEKLVRDFASRTLQDAGYQVFEASNGEEALGLYEKRNSEIDLLLLDVMMPKMGGIRALELIHRLNADVPALFMSGYSDDDDTMDSIHGKGHKLIAKPFSGDTLLGAVRERLG